MITTLNKIRARSPCRAGWEKLLRHLNKTTADDEPLPISAILDSNGLDDAIWCLRTVEGRDREMRLYAVWCARQVQHLMTDPRSLAALDVAEEYARGRASTAKLTETAWTAWAARASRAAWEAKAVWASAAEVATDAAEASAYSAWQAGADKATQAAELRRICQEIEAGRDPYPEEAQP